jgi:cytosine deaminase
MSDTPNYNAMLSVAIEEAKQGLAEGGIPIGAALFDRQGNKIMVTTLAPCWYCSGLVRQFQIGTVVVGESANFSGGAEWLKEHGVEVIDLGSRECTEMLALYIKENPHTWNEDIGEGSL